MYTHRVVSSNAVLMADTLRALREARGLSRSQLSRTTASAAHRGISESTLEALETKPGRVPHATTIEILARTLGVEPATFYEYPIASGRRSARALAPQDASRRPTKAS